MTRRTAVNVLTLALLAIHTACSGATGAPRGSSTELTREEIQAAGVSDLLEAVQRLRPRWLQVRAPRSINAETAVMVFTGRNYVGGIESLRQFDSRSLVRLRYLDAAQATATLNVPSGQHIEGAIVVELIAGAR